MQTTTQEIIYQVLMILVSVSIVGVAGYVRKYIKGNTTRTQSHNPSTCGECSALE